MPTSTRLPFSRTQIISLVIFGIVLWFAAATALRLLGPMGVYEGAAHVILYGLIVPGTWPFVLIAKRLIRIPGQHIALGYSLATTAAMLCDGIALAWFPALYGGTAELVAGAGAAILWGAGVGIAIALLMNSAAATDPA